MLIEVSLFSVIYPQRILCLPSIFSAIQTLAFDGIIVTKSFLKHFQSFYSSHSVTKTKFNARLCSLKNYEIIITNKPSIYLQTETESGDIRFAVRYR